MPAETSTHNHLRFDWKPEEITAHAKDIISKARKVFDDVAAIPPAQASFANVVVPIAKMEGWFAYESSNTTFLQYVHTNKEVRDASVAANKELDEFEIESSMRVDVYKSVVAAAEKKEKLEVEDARLLEHTLRDFKRNGLALPDEQREKLAALKKQLADISVDFSQTLNTDVTEVLFTREELDGMPDDFFDGRATKTDPEDGKEKFAVTMKYPDIIPTMRMAKHEKTRQRLDFANGAKCQPNIALLEKAIDIRRQIAALLGYPTYADYVLEVKMAKQTKIVKSFMDSLRAKLVPFGEKERAKLLELKKQETAERGLPFDNKLNAWDFQYYNRLMLERDYQVDDEKIKQYFSLETVTQGMLKLYETVLSLKITEVKEGVAAWHEDVRLFQVFDKAGDFVGHFYLDLHPRENKYSHAAAFQLQPGQILEDGSRQYPVAAMVANFSKPTPTKPSLLKHNEVVTYFHELGHIMHQLCSQTKWSKFHGTRVEGDFVEAPSQMLENWCWEPEILKVLSAHYEKGASSPLPDDLINALVKAKNVNAALLALRQLFFGYFDMQVHTVENNDTRKIDSTALWNSLREDVTLIPGTEGTWPAAAFGHIMGGYEAGYYGYMWSQVYSADMFYSRFKKEGLQNPGPGKSYRSEILVPGGSRDGQEMLKRFLGREPNDAAFLKSIGLEGGDAVAGGAAPIVD
ncbi:Thimet oligopeptidase [Rhizophlyctis rosea]|nr:Thimet oligopeptidase [Rhizophlyctis rosea]